MAFLCCQCFSGWINVVVLFAAFSIFTVQFVFFSLSVLKQADCAFKLGRPSSLGYSRNILQRSFKEWNVDSVSCVDFCLLGFVLCWCTHVLVNTTSRCVEVSGDWHYLWCWCCTRGYYLYRYVSLSARNKWRYDFKPTKDAPVYHAGAYRLTSSQWRSDGGAGRTGRHLLGAAKGRKTPKFFFLIYVKIQIVSFICVCVQEKQSVTASVYLSSAITLGI